MDEFEQFEIISRGWPTTGREDFSNQSSTPWNHSADGTKTENQFTLEDNTWYQLMQKDKTGNQSAQQDKTDDESLGNCIITWNHVILGECNRSLQKDVTRNQHLSDEDTTWNQMANRSDVGAEIFPSPEDVLEMKRAWYGNACFSEHCTENECTCCRTKLFERENANNEGHCFNSSLHHAHSNAARHNESYAFTQRPKFLNACSSSSSSSRTRIHPRIRSPSDPRPRRTNSNNMGAYLAESGKSKSEDGEWNDEEEGDTASASNVNNISARHDRVAIDDSNTFVDRNFRNGFGLIFDESDINSRLQQTAFTRPSSCDRSDRCSGQFVRCSGGGTGSGQFDRVMCRTRKFSTDSGRVVNRGDTLRIFNRLRNDDLCSSSESEIPRVNRGASVLVRSSNDKTVGTDERGAIEIGFKDECTICESKEHYNVYDECKQLLAEEDEADRKVSECDSNEIPSPSFQQSSSQLLRNEWRAIAAKKLLSTGDRNDRCQLKSTDTIDNDHLLKVLLLGSQGVGKTTITQQLLTSEYQQSDSSLSYNDNIIAVQLDQVQFMVQFVDVSGSQANHNTDTVDAYFVIYSVTDRSSFKYANACLRELRSSRADHVIILVANKEDLVRKRTISDTCGKRLAAKRGCKFIEISAFLDHRLDELLVGVIKQIEIRRRDTRTRNEADKEEEDEVDEAEKLMEEERGRNRSGCLQHIKFKNFWRYCYWQQCTNSSCSSSASTSSCDNLFV